MNRVIVRTLAKDKLFVYIYLPSQVKRFERSSQETVKSFISRLKEKLFKDSRCLSVVDASGKSIDDNSTLIKAFCPPNQLFVNGSRFEILFNPPTIENLIIPKTPISGLVLLPSIKTVNLNETDVEFIWECRSHEDESWSTLSRHKIICVSKDLKGKFIRLRCLGSGCEAVSSNEIGPVIEDDDMNSLLRRVIPPIKSSLRIMTYNILADCYMKSSIKPFTNFHPYCPKQFQLMDYREPRIVSEIHAHSPSILCLQEVEGKSFTNRLVPMLPDYEGHITVIIGRNKAGCALFYKKEEFNELDYQSCPLPDMYGSDSPLENVKSLGNKMTEMFPDTMKDIRIRPVVTQIIVLEEKSTGKIVIVGNTHLYWNPTYHIISLLHAHAMCCKIDSIRSGLGRACSVLVCGDLNSQVTSHVYSYLTTGRVENKVGSPLEEYLSQNVVNPLSLTLARGNPHFTNYTPDFKDVIDYVLCDSESTVAQVTPSSDLEDLEKSPGCPSAIFPSDHLPVISDIMLG